MKKIPLILTILLFFIGLGLLVYAVFSSNTEDVQLLSTIVLLWAWPAGAGAGAMASELTSS